MEEKLYPTRVELFILSYLVKYIVGTPKSIAKYSGISQSTVRGALLKLRKKALVDCYRYSTLESILDKEAFERIRKKLKDIDKREVICYANISREELEEKYLRPLNLKIDDILKWKGARRVNYESLERLKEKLMEE